MSKKCKLVPSLSYIHIQPLLFCLVKVNGNIFSWHFSLVLSLAVVFHYTFLPDLCLQAIPAGELFPGTQTCESDQSLVAVSQSMQYIISPVASTQTYKPWMSMSLLQLQVLRFFILFTGYSLAYLSKWKLTHVHTCPLRIESIHTENIVRSEINEKVE